MKQTNIIPGLYKQTTESPWIYKIENMLVFIPFNQFTWGRETHHVRNCFWVLLFEMKDWFALESNNAFLQYHVDKPWYNKEIIEHSHLSKTTSVEYVDNAIECWNKVIWWFGSHSEEQIIDTGYISKTS